LVQPDAAFFAANAFQVRVFAGFLLHFPVFEPIQPLFWSCAYRVKAASDKGSRRNVPSRSSLPGTPGRTIQESGGLNPLTS